MGAVTVRGVFGLFALAEPSIARFVGGEFLRGEPGALVRPIAERLVRGLSTGAIPVVFTFLEGDFCGGLGGDVRRVFHVEEFSTRFAGGNPRFSLRADRRPACSKTQIRFRL